MAFAQPVLSSPYLACLGSLSFWRVPLMVFVWLSSAVITTLDDEQAMGFLSKSTGSIHGIQCNTRHGFLPLVLLAQSGLQSLGHRSWRDGLRACFVCNFTCFCHNKIRHGIPNTSRLLHDSALLWYNMVWFMRSMDNELMIGPLPLCASINNSTQCHISRKPTKWVKASTKLHVMPNIIIIYTFIQKSVTYQ